MALVQVRGVSAGAHRRLKRRAADRGQSLSEYLRTELEELAEHPTVDEVAKRIAKLEPVGGETGAEAVRAARAERELPR
jgi:hypothetical protein